MSCHNWKNNYAEVEHLGSLSNKPSDLFLMMHACNDGAPLPLDTWMRALNAKMTFQHILVRMAIDFGGSNHYYLFIIIIIILVNFFF